MKSFNVTTLAASILAFVLPALAQQPVITEIPAEPFTAVAGPSTCPFDVRLAPEVGKPNAEKAIQFSNTTIVTGPLFLTLTNLSSGKSIALNVSGPGVDSFTGGIPTQFRDMGPLLLFAVKPAVAQAAGLPSMALINGLTVFNFSSGDLASITYNGTVQNVCQMLE